MKRTLPLLLIFLASFVSAQVLDRPVAIVRLTDTINIGVRRLESQIELFQQQIGRELTVPEREQILDALVNDALLLQAATRTGVRVTQAEIQNYLNVQKQQWSQLVGRALTDAEFRAQVEAQTGAPYADFVQDITDELLKLKYVRQEKADIFASRMQVSEAEIVALYEEQATSFTNPAMVSFRHIYVDLRGKSNEERAEARALLTRLRREITNGTRTFEEIERASLDDPAYSADNYGYVLRNDARSQQILGRAFIDQLFSMQLGEIGGVYESAVALHIVLITDKRPPRILGLDDPLLPGQSVTVRQQIRSVIAAQKEQEALAAAVQDVVEDLRDEAEITIFTENLPW
jgi:parvulin-like peptidyl-prolyl isomerase